MKFNKKRRLSLLVAIMMFFGLFANVSFTAMADTNESKNDEEIVIQRILDEMEFPKVEYKGEKFKLNPRGDQDQYEKEFLSAEDILSPDEEVRFIVELYGNSVAKMSNESNFYSMANDKSVTDSIKESQESTIKSVRKISRDLNVRRRYTTLLNGFSVEGRFENMEALKNLPNVKKVTVSNMYYPDMTTAGDMVGNIEYIRNELNLKGQGMVVSIIDSGIDYNHKDMRLSDTTTNQAIKMDDIPSELKGRYFTAKVPYGYNYADDNQDVIPAVGTSSHGMHVAGIVGANCENDSDVEDLTGIRGMAPECQLLAMKVFTNSPAGGGAWSDDVIAAIEDSVKMGADVINMSLGSTARFQKPNDLEQLAVKNATEAGVLVAISAGNSSFSTYPYQIPWINDNGVVGSPGVTHESLQVASYNNTHYNYKGISYFVNGEVKTAPFQEGSGESAKKFTDKKGYETVYCGIGVDEKEFEGVDVEGKIALIQRGVHSFADKVKSAEERGAVAAFIFNDAARGDDLLAMSGVETCGIPSIFMGHTAGAEMVENNSRVFFPGTVTHDVSPNANKMSYFTSWGPTPNLDFKPQITGIGGNVWSTIARNEYEDMSGTSMASPFVAGCAALVKQSLIEKEWDSLEETDFDNQEFLKNMLINTADVVVQDVDEYAMEWATGEIVHIQQSKPYSPRRQGAGLVNIDKALENEVLVTYNGEAVMGLKEMDKNNSYTVTVKNYGEKNLSYKLETVQGVLTAQDEVQQPAYEVSYPGASIEFDKDVIEVTTGSTVTFDVNIKFSDKAPVGKFAEGFIRLVPEQDVPEIGIPFMGFYGEWDKEQIIEDSKYNYDSPYKFFDNTALLDQDQYVIGARGVIDPSTGKQKLVYLEEFAAINPTSEDNQIPREVAPVLCLNRNAKELEVVIEDKDLKEISTMALEKNLRKCYSEQTEYGVSSKDWYWDGTVFDKEVGEYKLVPDGQYYVNSRARVDFEGADFQDFRMAVKVDTTGPEIAMSQPSKNTGDECTIEFKIEDLTGVNNFVVVNRNLINPKELVIVKEDKIKFDSETGMYTAEVPLAYPAGFIEVSAIDEVGNQSSQGVLALNESYIGLEITKPEYIVSADEPVKVEYSLNEDLGEELIKSVDHNTYSLYDLGKESPLVKKVEDIKTAEYDFGVLNPGNYAVEVVALDKDDKLVATGYRFFAVGTKNLAVQFTNLGNQEFNTREIELEGRVSSKPVEFTINGENVQMNYGEKNPLEFTHKVVFEGCGQQKIVVHYKGEDGMVRDFSINCYIDDIPAEITVDEPAVKVQDKNIYEVIVSEDAENYVLSGTVNDNTLGYSFYINGEEKINVDNGDSILPDKLLQKYEETIKLESQTTIVELKAKDRFANETLVKVMIYKGEKPVGNFKLIDNNEGKEFKKGEEARVTFTAVNECVEDKNVAIGIGLFDEKGRMINKIGNTQLIKVGSEVQLTMLMNVPESGVYSIKCFVWDSFDAGNPLTDCLEFVVK